MPRSPLRVAHVCYSQISTPALERVREKAQLFEGVHLRVFRADGLRLYPELPGEGLPS